MFGLEERRFGLFKIVVFVIMIVLFFCNNLLYRFFCVLLSFMFFKNLLFIDMEYLKY